MLPAGAGRVSDATVKLSSLDVHALGAMEKHGELILDFSGEYFVNSTGYGSVDRKRIERLVARGLARVDVVGESTFAVSLRTA